MGLEAKFTGDIDGMFKAFILEVERQIIESLCRIGEEAVSMAKTCLLYTSLHYLSNYQQPNVQTSR